MKGQRVKVAKETGPDYYLGGGEVRAARAGRPAMTVQERVRAIADPVGFFLQAAKGDRAPRGQLGLRRRKPGPPAAERADAKGS